MNRLRTLALALILGVLLGQVTSGGGLAARVAAQSMFDALTRFTNCDAFVRHMREIALGSVTADGFGGGYAVLEGKGGARRVPDPAGPATGLSGTTHSLGLDETRFHEPRQVELRAPLTGSTATDGRLLLTASGAGFVSVVDLRGKQPRQAGTVRHATNAVTSLVVAGDRALMIGELRAAAVPRPGQGATALTLLDLSDPDRPRVAGSMRVNGRAYAVRSDTGLVRIVLASQPQLNFAEPGLGENARADALERNRTIIETAGAAEWLPVRQVLDASGAVRSKGSALTCSDVMRPSRAAGVDLLTMLQVDLRAADPLTSSTGSAVVANGNLMTFSPDGTRAYVATQPDRWWSQGPVVDENQVQPIAPRASTPVTAVHAFGLAFGVPGRPAYLGSASVEGYLLGPGALSGRVTSARAATVVPPQTAGERPTYRVSRLDLALTGAAPAPVSAELPGGVRAVRWFDDTAVTVPLNDTDDWRLVDLTDPLGPKVGATLPLAHGSDTYLQDLPGGRLLAFGGDPYTDSSWIESFDISDPQAARQLDHLAMPSQIVDAHSVAYLPDRQLVVFPGLVVRHLTPAQQSTERKRVVRVCEATERRMHEQDPYGHASVDCGGGGSLDLRNVVRALQVDADGTLRVAGTYLASGSRILETGGLVHVTDDYASRLTTLSPPGLTLVTAFGLTDPSE